MGIKSYWWLYVHGIELRSDKIGALQSVSNIKSEFFTLERGEKVSLAFHRLHVAEPVTIFFNYIRI